LLVFASFVAALVAVAVVARAEAARVALVHSERPDALEQRTLTRLRAELAAAGFEVTDIARSRAGDREAAEVEPPMGGVFATIAIAPRSPDAADVWVADRITGKTLVRRVQGGPGRDVAAVLAVRAVELLQASLLEATESSPQRERASSAPLPPDVSAWMQKSGPRMRSGFGLVAGAGLFHSFDGIPPAIVPVFGLSYRLSAPFALCLRASTPSFPADLETPYGTIAVHQDLASIELSYSPAPGGRIRPLAMLGVGAYRLGVAGTAAAPYEGRRGHVFSAMFDAGVGAALSLGTQVSLVADVRLLYLAPKPIVRAAGLPFGEVRRPSLLGAITAEVAF
jgi:hypothetical protein